MAALVLCFPVSARELVAKIYGKSIYRDELQGAGKNLESMVLPPLYERFATENHLVATKAEIADFIAATNDPAQPAMRPGESAVMRDMAKTFVLNWKISKALYQKYGGEVIFQQANPMEPIGAERQFLEAQEKAGAFTIVDTQERAKFYAYYLPPYSFVISPSDVNYEQPWWRQ